jgi:hypothetical protein
MPVDFRTLHAYLDAEAPGRRFVENVARLNFHEDAELNRLLGGDPDNGSAPLHELGGLPARVSLTVLLDSALVVEPATNPGRQTEVIDGASAHQLVATGQSSWLAIDGHEVGLSTTPTEWITRPDVFDVSWLTSDELAGVCARLRRTPRLLHAPARAALAAMRDLDAAGYTSRLVFWFT